MKKNLKLVFVLMLICFSTQIYSQTTEAERSGEFYFSWGYNTEWYNHSNVYISQPSLGNNFVMENVHAHDHKGWNEGLFSKALTIPQYNYRIGWFFNPEKGLGVEINFDHTKYIITNNQTINVKGTVNGVQTNGPINFSDSHGFHYFLNNGANFLLFNFVKRWNVVGKNSKHFKLDAIGKVGAGPVIPHVDNQFYGEEQGQPYNKPHFQIGGWNTGVEACVRATFFKYVFLEYTNKVDYAAYSHLKIYEGYARQSFTTYEMMLNLGVTFPIGHRLEHKKTKI